MHLCGDSFTRESCQTFIAGNMFDEMPKKKLKPWSGETSGGGGCDSTMVPADRLSSLPDAMLHHVMSFLRAWEVVRTCVLSRRWRDLWASAPCADLRVWCLGRHLRPPYQLARFFYNFLLEREVSAPLDTLRLFSSPLCDLKKYDEGYCPYTTVDVDIWIRAAIKRRARIIQLSQHPMDEAITDFDNVNIISCHLKHLKLSGCLLVDRTLRQLSSQCPSLEVLDLKNCYLDGQGISSMSLKSLAIVKCWIIQDLTIATPNLVSLHCITPHHRVPLFENLGSITRGIIVLDDSFLYVGYEYEYKDINKDAIYEGSDSNSYSSFGDDLAYGSDADSDSDASTFEYSEIANEYEGKQHSDCGEGHRCYNNHCLYHGYSGRQDYKSGYGYHSNYQFDRSKVLGGHNIIQSLANATSLELLADAGEMILNRELKACPIFINLKTLSLGEWCMADDFKPLVFFLQHTPNMERLFLELKLDCSRRRITEDMGRPEGRSFACTHLKMVKINCCKHDARVHLLAHLFMVNGVPIEKIYVHRARSTCFPSK